MNRRAPVPDLLPLLRSLEPVLNPGIYVFASVPHGSEVSTLAPVAMIREKEGLTIVMEEAAAESHGLQVLFRAAWITLSVQSELQAVGLTAAFAEALGNANISCNVIAGAFHDHLFVPADAAREAMAVLRNLQQQALAASDRR